MANFDPGLGAFVLVGTVAGGLFNLWRRRNRPRTIVDERGERQYVKTWNRGQPVYDPKTWQQRIFEEAALRTERRKAMLMSGPFVFGPLYGIYYAYVSQNIFWEMATYPLGALAVGMAVMFFLPAFFRELLYQTGYQGMQGAKVLDRQPTAQPGREVVETQKAHGDARLAGEAEALSLLNSKK